MPPFVNCRVEFIPCLAPYLPTPLQATLKEFLEAEGIVLSDNTKDDPPLAKFEEQIAKYKQIATQIQALPSLQSMGWVKVNAKPLRCDLDQDKPSQGKCPPV